MGSIRDESDGLLRSLVGAVAGAPVAVAKQAAAWARHGGRLAVEIGGDIGAAGRAAVARLAPALRLAELLGMPSALRVMATAWQQAHQRCTPSIMSSPRVPTRRILVQVAGLGSASGAGAVLEVEPAELGYAAGDVVQFSYRGGTTAQNSYTPADTTQDIRESGLRLRLLIRDLRRSNPGIPIDVVAHSQGGLVARYALRSNTSQVSHLVTLATPHRGANLATTWGWVRKTDAGDRLAGAVDGPLPFPAEGTSLGQLSETSEIVEDLARTPIPPGLRVTSIAAAHDLVVPAARCRLPGATNVIVTPGGISAHDALPGSAAGRREVALALNDRPPGCVSVLGALLQATTSEAINAAEHQLGLLATLTAGAASTRP